ncbi:hypothetical protein BGZ65_005710 [Modicella reniformis]|uniref:PH domain-containing protein n=1 Tax=Modicella reniformis TaxID=1440133 RepID=A0A9P6LXK3_9FUNG|nr:hypothetical protein BGZ65_005710 [Modicella reniformis]
MEEKKKSTLGKAFARTFSRKQSLSTKAAPTALVEAATAPAASAPAVPVPAAAATPAPENSVETPSVPDAQASVAPPASGANSVSPIPIPTPPDSVNVSTQQPHNGSPKSPINHSVHVREGTAFSNTSTMSHHGLGEDGEGLNPADILLHRLDAFRVVIKNLQMYFDDIAQVETGVSKAMNKASGVIVVPFKDGHQFLGNGGLQDVCIGIRDSAKTRSEHHANAARFIEETIVKNMRRLKQDIKGKIKALKADASLYSNKVFKEREATQEKIASLAKAIGLFDMSGQHHHDMEKANSDPFIINLALKRQLAKQVHEENLFAHALKQCQEEIKTFEAHIIKEVKQILASFSEYHTNNAANAFSQSWAPTQLALNILEEDSEWNNFLEHHGHRLFPSDMVDANPDDIDYPCKDNPYVLPVKSAHLTRQTSMLKSWKEGYFVLTLAGWLHVFASADHEKDYVPDQSIYIPTSTLGPHTEPGQKQHVFSLDGKGKGGLLHKDTQTFTLRAHSREEMVEWWSEISKRAHSSTFTQPGNGSLDAISRTSSVVGSSSPVHSKAEEHTQPSPPNVAQEHHDEKAAGSPQATEPVATPAATPAPAS